MSNKVKKREEIDPKYKWCLEDIMPSDEQWEKQYKETKKLIKKATKIKGTLGNSSDALKEGLDEINKLELSVEELFVYARMKRDENNQDSKYQALADRGMQLIVEAESAMAFITPEILDIDKDKLESFFKECETLKTYTQVIREITDKREHTLSYDEEKILAMAGEVAGGPDKIYTMFTDADMKFPSVEKDGETIPVTQGRFINLLESKDRKLREDVFKSFYSTFKSWENTLAATYTSSVKTDIFFAKTRKYDSALHASLSSDDVAESVYTSLIEAVHGALPFMHRLMDVKRKALGVDKLHMYDLYVPTVQSYEKEVSYEQGKELMIEGLSALGEEYINIMKDGLEGGTWVDVFENEGKSSGAYSWGVWGKHPFVLMNWTDDINSTFTLAHELGHAMHSYYADETQEYHDAGYSLLVAEIASTCNEALLMDYMLNNSSSKEEKLFLTNYFLEQFRTTVFRQVMFAEFEMIVHKQAEEGIAHTPETLSKIYYDLNKLYYGDNMIIDEEIAMEWARIPHFYRAFYVYKYATGFSSAIALSKMILEGNEDDQQKYLNFLKGGGSKYPLELLKEAGVDLTTPEPVAKALERFAELVELMEQEL